MKDVAARLDDLRIAVGETEAIAAVTAESFDRQDWSGADQLHTERLASLLGLIEKSASAALAAFHRLSVAVVNEQPAPVGQRWYDGDGTSIRVGKRKTCKAVARLLADGWPQQGSKQASLRSLETRRSSRPPVMARASATCVPCSSVRSVRGRSGSGVQTNR